MRMSVGRRREEKRSFPPPLQPLYLKKKNGAKVAESSCLGFMTAKGEKSLSFGFLMIAIIV